MYLFNFSSSYSGGGLKRLEEFSKWFSRHGGATFFINKKSNYLAIKYPENKYIIAKISKLSRLLNREQYLNSFPKKNFQIYYSYGIPITKKVAKINILHISNVLPFVNGDFGYNFIENIKFSLLKNYFIKSFKYTDVLSAESEFSISLFDNIFLKNKIVSKNGSDDEINYFNQLKGLNYKSKFENYAVVLGTHKHKAILESYLLYKKIKQEYSLDKLIIIGSKNYLPKEIFNDNSVDLLGVLERPEILKLLARAKIYISTTKVENSYNAASEAIFMAEKSFISTISPHFELLKGLKFKIRNFEALKLNMIEINAADLDTRNLENWDNIIEKILQIKKYD